MLFCSCLSLRIGLSAFDAARGGDGGGAASRAERASLRALNTQLASALETVALECDEKAREIERDAVVLGARWRMQWRTAAACEGAARCASAAAAAALCGAADAAVAHYAARAWTVRTAAQSATRGRAVLVSVLRAVAAASAAACAAAAAADAATFATLGALTRPFFASGGARDRQAPANAERALIGVRAACSAAQRATQRAAAVEAQASGAGELEVMLRAQNSELEQAVADRVKERRKLLLKMQREKNSTAARIEKARASKAAALDSAADAKVSFFFCTADILCESCVLTI